MAMATYRKEYIESLTQEELEILTYGLLQDMLNYFDTIDEPEITNRIESAILVKKLNNEPKNSFEFIRWDEYENLSYKDPNITYIIE